MGATTGHHPQRVLDGIAAGQRTLGADGGFDLRPARDAGPPLSGPLVQQVGFIFDVQGFAHARMPLAVGPAPLDDVPDGTRISSLAIKFPHTSYRVPSELQWASAALELAASAEHQINPRANDYYAYVTVQRTEVVPGEVQRGSAIHSDGIQGPRIQPKQPIERGYLTVDKFPPLFYVQAFDVDGISPDRHLMDAVFDRQADPARAVSFPAQTLVLFDSYCVHQAVPATEPGPRCFLRVAYSTRQYDRLGNTINALFADEYEREGWTFVPRPLPASLADPYAG